MPNHSETFPGKPLPSWATKSPPAVSEVADASDGRWAYAIVVYRTVTEASAQSSKHLRILTVKSKIGQHVQDRPSRNRQMVTADVPRRAMFAQELDEQLTYVVHFNHRDNMATSSRGATKALPRHAGTSALHSTVTWPAISR